MYGTVLSQIGPCSKLNQLVHGKPNSNCGMHAQLLCTVLHRPLKGQHCALTVERLCKRHATMVSAVLDNTLTVAFMHNCFVQPFTDPLRGNCALTVERHYKRHATMAQAVVLWL